MKAAILVDEMNIIGQLHRIGVQGINPWVTFYQAIEEYLRLPTDFHMYCANVPEDTHPEQHQKRKGFFQALEKVEIQVHQGFTVATKDESLLEKGVDTLLSLDLSNFALDGYKDIVVCSGDGDLVPAIEQAQLYGSRVHVVVSKAIPAKHVVQVADNILPLEDVLNWLSPKHVKLKKHMKESA